MARGEGGGKPAHVPTKESRNQVEAMVSFGIPQQEIADVLEIDKKTLYKYYRRELDTAAAKANAKVASMLYNKCMKGDTTSIIFWLKTKAKWREKDDDDKDKDKAEVIINYNIIKDA